MNFNKIFSHSSLTKQFKHIWKEKSNFIKFFRKFFDDFKVI
jgi:hypothetical protein